MIDSMLIGAIALASLLIGLFFLRFWRNTRDRFFLYFALSFFIEGLNRIYVGLHGGLDDDSPTTYIFRLIAFGLILIAILEKNRPPKKS